MPTESIAITSRKPKLADGHRLHGAEPSFKRKMRTWLKCNKHKIGRGKDGRFVNRVLHPRDYTPAH